MGRIVVSHEARRPLTDKRIFDTKLHGLPLCLIREDLEYNIQLLIDNNIFSQDRGYRLIVTYPMYVISNSGGMVDHLLVGQTYTVAE